MGFRGVTQGEIVFHTQCELPRRCQPHEHLASLRRRGGHFFDLHHLGTTKCMDAHGFHNITLTSLVLQDMHAR